MKTVEEIKTIIEGIIADSELFVVEIKVLKNNIIEIFIDAPKGVNIDTCSRISRQIEACLDREDEDFELTVSSAGIGYPFKVAGQYQKNIGNKVVVKTVDTPRTEGILKAYDGEKIMLECEEKRPVEGKKKKETVKVEKTILLSDIKEIKDVVEMKWHGRKKKKNK